MTRLLGIVATAGALLVSACGQQPYQTAQNVDPCMQANNPRECAEVRNAGGSVNDYLMYGLAGYTFARIMTPYGYRNAIVPDPYYHGSFHHNDSYYRSRTYVTSPTYRTTGAPLNTYTTRRVVTTTTVQRQADASPGRSTPPPPIALSKPSAPAPISLSKPSISKPSYSFSKSSSTRRK